MKSRSARAGAAFIAASACMIPLCNYFLAGITRQSNLTPREGPNC
jgi:hypothetical protein